MRKLKPDANELHIYVHNDDSKEILRLLRMILYRESELMADVNDLAAAVADERTVIDSAVALLDGLSAQLAEALANDDPAAVQAVLDSITANRDALAAAVEANTPGTEPAPEPEPTPEP